MEWARFCRFSQLVRIQVVRSQINRTSRSLEFSDPLLAGIRLETRLLVLLCGLLMAAAVASAQLVGGRSYPFPDESLKGTVLAEDQQGFLWVGTTKGLYRLDGYHYLPVGQWTGIPSEEILALTVAHDGAVWVGTPKGLYRVYGSHAERISGASQSRLWELCPLGEGILAVSDAFEFWRREEAKWVAHPVPADHPAAALHRFGDEAIYPSGLDLLYVRQNGLEVTIRKERMSLPPLDAWREALRAGEWLLVAGASHVVYLKFDTHRQSWKTERVEVAEVPTGRALMAIDARPGSRAGVSVAEANVDETLVFDGSTLVRYPNYQSTTASIDSIALASGALASLHPSAAGVTVFDPSRSIQGWTERLGLSETPVKPDRIDGRISVATQLGLFQLEELPASANSCRPPSYLSFRSYFCRVESSPAERYYDLQSDRNGGRWAVTRRQGVIRLRPDGALDAAAPNLTGLPIDIRELAFAPDHRVFAAAKMGMLEVLEGSPPRLKPVPQFPLVPWSTAVRAGGPNYVADFSFAPSGELWASVEGGVARYRNGQWERISVPCLLTPHTGSMAVESDTSIWISNRDDKPFTRLYRKSADDPWQCHHMSAKEFAVQPNLLRIDNQRRLWRENSGSLSVARLDTPDPPDSVQDWIPIGPDEGAIAGTPGVDGFWQDTNGDIWISFDKGLNRIPKDFPLVWDPARVAVVAVGRDDGWDWLTTEGWHTAGSKKPIHKLYLANLPVSPGPAPRAIMWRGLTVSGSPVTGWQSAVRGVVVEIGDWAGQIDKIEFQTRGRKSLGEFVLFPAPSRYSGTRLWVLSAGTIVFLGLAFWLGAKTRWGSAMSSQLQQILEVRRERAKYWTLKKRFEELKYASPQERQRILEQLPEESRRTLTAILADAASEDDAAGTVIAGRFLIEHPMAKGGFATVYFGRDLECNREPVAIKLIRFRPDLSEWINRRWKLEQKALESLHHPGILQPREAGVTDDDQLFIVTEYVEGVTVQAVLTRGSMELGRAWARTCEICEALEYAHTSGILHFDLKPDNIMLRNVGQSDERAVVIDFGTAVFCAPDHSILDSNRAAGAADYMSPDRLGGTLSTATDVYSLALVVFEMLTAVRWRDAEATGRTESLLQRVLSQPATEERCVRLTTVFRNASAFDAHARTRTVVEFKSHLSVALERA